MPIVTTIVTLAASAPENVAIPQIRILPTSSLTVVDEVLLLRPVPPPKK